jgi:hypothetical protein
MLVFEPELENSRVRLNRHVCCGLSLAWLWIYHRQPLPAGFAYAVKWIHQKETRLMIPSAGIDPRPSWRGGLVPATR